MVANQQDVDDFASVYRRELPGGGYVAISVHREFADREVPRIRVSVERRTEEERRSGHMPIVIAEAEGDEESPRFTELYKIAADNAAIARELLRMGMRHPERAD